MRQTEPTGLALGVFEMEKRNGHPIRHAVEHCDFDRLTVIRTFSLEQRVEHCGVGVHPGCDVRNRNADF